MMRSPVEVVEQETAEGVYERLCTLAHISPATQPLQLSAFDNVDKLVDVGSNERLTAAIQVLLQLVSEDTVRVERIDRVLLDHYICKLDQAIGLQLDAILHHPEFQALESLWLGLKYLVKHCDEAHNIKLELLDVQKTELQDNFDASNHISQSALYKHIYMEEYDTPGGEPVSAMVSDFEFQNSPQDISLLTNLAKVATAAHCPFLGVVGPAFFDKHSYEEVTAIDDLSTYMERAEYLRWDAFRRKDESRYIGLTLPRFLLRLPYGADNPVRAFQYEEGFTDIQDDPYVWGASSFAFAAKMADSFRQYGWAVHVRGPESGGKVAGMLLHQYDHGHGLQTHPPSEVLIAETCELNLAEQGFIPLSYYKNSDYACFFSANSVHKPAVYTQDQATANSRINAKLPYIFLISRLAHYLKVLQRENIGSSKNRLVLEQELNTWLRGLVTEMESPGPDLAATHPLRQGQVSVEEVPDNPGYYRVHLLAMPHFQIEGMDAQLSLVSELPATVQ